MKILNEIIKKNSISKLWVFKFQKMRSILILVDYCPIHSTLLSGSRFTSCDIYLDVLFICVALFLSSFNAIDFNIEKEKRNQSIPCIFE